MKKAYVIRNTDGTYSLGNAEPESFTSYHEAEYAADTLNYLREKSAEWARYSSSVTDQQWGLGH